MHSIVHNVGVAAQIGNYSDATEVPPVARWLLTSGMPKLPYRRQPDGNPPKKWVPDCIDRFVDSASRPHSPPGSTFRLDGSCFTTHQRNIWKSSSSLGRRNSARMRLKASSGTARPGPRARLRSQASSSAAGMTAAMRR